MTLFAGAGIVPGSVALSEWAETGVKVGGKGREGKGSDRLRLMGKERKAENDSWGVQVQVQEGLVA